MTTILIYGAAGYTGKLISQRAREAGLDFEIAGRNETKTAALARELGVPYHIVGVDDAAALRAGLDGISAVLNCPAPSPARPKP